jgi:uncharacterized protein (DUF1800 family)
MGNKKFSRRSFFKSLGNEELAVEEGVNGSDDPLFEKYSRKSLTPRHYSDEQIAYAVRESPGSSPSIRVGNVTSGLAPYAGAWTEWEVLHLLRRTNFGWKKSFVDSLLPLSPSAAVDFVCTIDPTPPAPPVNWYQNFFADENNGTVPYGADWTNDAFNSTSVGQSSNHYRMDAMRRWLFGLTLNGDATIREKMVWFWYHFIPIDFEFIYQSSNSYINTNCARVFYRYFKLLRSNATGNFKTLIRSIATEPAMMFYLNNQANTASAPDENFARELMELFTIGKDNPNNTYSQSDVVEAAKVLTGWRVQSLNTANPVTNFLSGSHKQGNKTFSSFFDPAGTSTVTITGQAGAAGANEIDALVNMIFSKDVIVSQYICRRLYRYFVYYDIDANIEANVIVPLAQTFVANNWNILPVLKQLFKSEHFFDMANRGAYIKSPFDLVAGMANQFALNTTDANVEWQYRIWSKFNDGYGLSMEQQMGTIPNVSGWNAYYQTPAYHEYWINSNAIQKRFVYIRDLFNGFTVGSVTGRTFKADVIAFAQQFGAVTAADPDLLTAACVKYLLPIDLSQAQKDNFKISSLLSGQVTNSYWTTAWNDYLANPTNTTKKGTVETRLKGLLSGLCQLAEFQLM